jgi:formate hydrogenlyase subunit 3/multisubunit Na+/H+ antiporter MnhD subunit
MPVTATLCILGAMILSAIPPLSGFPAEWIMFVGIFQAGSQGSLPNLVLALAGIFATFLTPVYTFWPVMRIFFGQSNPPTENAKEAPLSMLVPLLVLAIISFILGVYPELITRFLIPVFSSLP